MVCIRPRAVFVCTLCTPCTPYILNFLSNSEGYSAKKYKISSNLSNFDEFRSFAHPIFQVQIRAWAGGPPIANRVPRILKKAKPATGNRGIDFRILADRRPETGNKFGNRLTGDRKPGTGRLEIQNGQTGDRKPGRDFLFFDRPETGNRVPVDWKFKMDKPVTANRVAIFYFLTNRRPETGYRST